VYFSISPISIFCNRCKCKDFRITAGLCAHVLAVAEKYGHLRETLEDISKISFDKMMQSQRHLSGRKVNEKKKRKSRNNKLKTAILSEVYNGL